jgi:hypothetical protein
MIDLKFLVASSVLVFSSLPASATIVIYSSPGAVQPAENVAFHNNVPSGNSATGHTNQTSTQVNFTGIEPLVTPSQGQARIEAGDGGLSQLSFELNSGLGFREVEFNIFGTGGTATQTVLNFTDQFGTVFSDTFAISNGENFFSALAIDNQFITRVQFLLNGNVQDARQFRIGGIGIVPDPDTSTVPEPESWAMLIVGFGLVGATMRRRSRMISVTA